LIIELIRNVGVKLVELEP